MRRRRRRRPTWRAACRPSTRCDRRRGTAPCRDASSRAPAAARGRSTDRCRAPALDDRVEARVDVEVAAVGPVRQLDHLADASRAVRPAPADLQEQPAGQPAGELAQLRIGRRRQVGEQRHRLVRRVVRSPRRPRPRRARRPRATPARSAGCGTSSRRDVVLRRLSSIASSASAPSFARGGCFSESWWPQSGRQLFPRRHRRVGRGRTPPATAR